MVFLICDPKREWKSCDTSEITSFDKIFKLKKILCYQLKQQTTTIGNQFVEYKRGRFLIRSYLVQIPSDIRMVVKM